MSELTDKIVADLKPVNTEELFDDMLDECYSFKEVGGIFAHMSPSRVLAECDPTAYRCGMNDYVDGLGLIEIEGDYYDSDECEKARDELVEEKESQIADLENELEALDDEDLGEAPGLKRQIAELKELRDEIAEEQL